jgi:hypothetical protein
MSLRSWIEKLLNPTPVPPPAEVSGPAWLGFARPKAGGDSGHAWKHWKIAPSCLPICL